VPVDARTIRYGLGAVKGTGEQAVNVILQARRSGGPFKDLFDFCERVDKRMVNRRTIEALIRAGAFDALDDHRARLLATVGIAIDWAEQQERNAMQAGLFDMGAAAEEHAPQPVDAPRWGEKRQLMEEKTALGFFFSGHPYNAVRGEVSRFVRRSLDRLEPQRELQLLAGLVTATRTKITGRGKMAFVTLDDGTTPQEVAVYSEVLDAERGKLREDEVLIVEGKVAKDDFAGEGRVRVTAERIMTLAEARGRFARELRLSLNGQVSRDRSAAERLKTLLGAYVPGMCPVRIAYRNGEATCELSLGDAMRVRLEDDLLTALGEWLNSDSVEIRYQ
jgi:DNA polymerase-3 subunit alpha